MTPLCFDVLLSNWELYPTISDGERDKQSRVNNLSLHPHFLSRQLSVVLHSGIVIRVVSTECLVYNFDASLSFAQTLHHVHTPDGGIRYG